MNTIPTTPKNKLEEWRSILLNNLQSGVNVYIVGDTETTGKEPTGDKKNFGLRDRIIEIGLLFYTKNENGTLDPIEDSQGQHIYLHEYVNPFREHDGLLDRYNSTREIPTFLTLTIHGIDLDFLNAKKGIVKNGNLYSRGDLKLPEPAGEFAKVKPIIENLMAIDAANTWKASYHFIAHNAQFDVKFLDCEWRKTEAFEEKQTVPSFWESYVKTIDTLELAKSIYKLNELKDIALLRGHKQKPSFKLDYLQEFYEVEIERNLHGALVDSKILAAVYNNMMLDPKYRERPNASIVRKDVLKVIEKKERNLVTI